MVPARRTPTPEDLEAKAEFISAFFDHFEDKVDFAASLYEQDRKDEAFILVCAYIEGIATYLMWPSESSRANFCRVLLWHGDEPVLALVHPRSLVRAMSGRGSEAALLASKLSALGPRVIDEMRPVAGFLDYVSGSLEPEELDLLRDHIHLDNLASVAHKGFRGAFAHRGSGPKGLVFEESSYRGGPAPQLDFHTLARALSRIVTYARKLSESTNKFFGHDLRSE